MTLIREEDLVESIADAFQYISYFHPPDFVTSLSSAWEREESQSAKDAMAQILVNSRMAAMGRRPICQDTGSANVYLEVGYDVKFDFSRSLQEVVDEGVRRGYQFDKNPLRASIVLDPIGSRKNSGDNTPALLTVDLVPGNTVSVYVSAKGGGSENKAKFAVLNPSDSVADWVVDTVEKLGAGWCPPGILGIGVGGSSDRAMAMAKKALNDPLDMQALLKNGPQNKSEELRVEIYERVNALGIGAQGLGGVTTVLDVKIKSFPTHAASLPVGLIPNCAATRHLHFTLDGTGVPNFETPDLAAWPEILLDEANKNARRVDVDNLNEETLASLKIGETLLLNGTIISSCGAGLSFCCAHIVKPIRIGNPPMIKNSGGAHGISPNKLKIDVGSFSDRSFIHPKKGWCLISIVTNNILYIAKKNGIEIKIGTQPLTGLTPSFL